LDSGSIGELGGIALCLGLNAFFSATETVITALAKLRRPDGPEPEDAARGLSLWIEHPVEVLTTILIGKNLCKLAVAVLLTDLALRSQVGFALPLAAGVATLLVLILGEMVPKAVAIPHAQSLAPRLLGALRLPHALLHGSGVARLMTALAHRLALGRQTVGDRPLLSESELEFLISLGAREGVLSEDKEEMLQSVLDFSDTLVKEIMVPRTEIKAVDVETDLATLRSFLREELHSRLPVFEGTIDHIVGAFHVKDILRLDEESFSLAKVMHPPHFVPMHMKINDLLKDLQRRRIHLAMVVDEFGGTAGMVTLEDILEEIVGDIGDEYDVEEQDFFVQAKDGSWAVDARAEVGDLEERLGLEFPEDRDYNSLGGFVTSQTGRILPPGGSFTYSGYEFEVLESDERRIGKVRIHRRDEASAEPAGDVPIPTSSEQLASRNG
jgi:magnesium and cobalt exporter, CNNM family